MSERKIKGVSITFNGEHEDKDGYLRCNKCNSKLMLMASPGHWGVDSEAFKNGERNPEDTPTCVFVGELTGHYCQTCEMLVSLSYNFLSPAASEGDDE